MRLFQLSRRFSSSDQLKKLLTKVPKIVSEEVQQGFLAKLFGKSKQSPTYLLLKELFAYLHSSKLLEQQFPFLKSEPHFQQNWMIMHLQILKGRLREQKTRSDAMNQMQLQKFNYNAQVYFFPPYAQYLNPHTPALNYATHFSQAYLKKFLVYDEHFQASSQILDQREISDLLRKFVYQLRVGNKDAELTKLTTYYLAHRNYLSMIQWGDLVAYKVKWGFEAQRALLTTLAE